MSNNRLPENPRLESLPIGIDLIRSMATNHSDGIAALMEIIDNTKDLQKLGKASSIHIEKKLIPNASDFSVNSQS